MAQPAAPSRRGARRVPAIALGAVCIWQGLGGGPPRAWAASGVRCPGTEEGARPGRSVALGAQEDLGRGGARGLVAPTLAGLCVVAALLTPSARRRCRHWAGPPRRASGFSPRPDSAVALRAGSSGLLLLEHLNLNVLSTEVALDFYEALGCVRDARRPMDKTLHTNCGALTQFHTPSPANEVFIGSEGAQRWRGEIELLYEDASGVRAAAARAKGLAARPGFAGSDLAVAEAGDEARVTDAYGNKFVLRVAPGPRRELLGDASGRRPGSEAAQVVAMGSVSLHVPPGAAAPGAQFYAEMLGFGTRELGLGRWAVTGGPGGDSQELVLEEVAGCTGEELGEHMAIYIDDFAGCFERLLAKGLIWVNPRFLHLDNSTTVEEAWKYNCFRFKDIVDLSTGEKLFELEHEVRSTGHKSCPLKA